MRQIRRCSSGRTVVRDVLVAVCLMGLGSSTCLAEPPKITAGDYARAERFLAWNKDRYLVNADIQHHWIGRTDRFWYLRTNASGEKEFVVVEAATGRRTAAFDQRALGRALSAATGQSIDAYRLPFSMFRYMEDLRAIEFRFSNVRWRCQLATFVCESIAELADAHEVLSPDGRWAAFTRDGNLLVRFIANGEERALTRDASEHYGYAGRPEYGTRRLSNGRYDNATPPQVLWSPDSRFVLTYRLDERNVKEMFVVQAAPEDGAARPKLHTFRYALPGDDAVPMLEPVVFDVAARGRADLATAPIVCLPQNLVEKRDAWWSADSGTVYYLDRNRYSRSVSLHAANPMTGEVVRLVVETSDTTVQTNANNIFDLPLIRTLSNGDIIWYSQRDGWGHLYYYDRRGSLRNRITQGEWAVRGIVRIDETRRTLFFTASGRGADPYEQRLYSVRFDGSRLRLLTPEEADHRWPRSLADPAPGLLADEAELQHFSYSGRYFVDGYSRPDLPPIMVVRAADGRLISRLEQADISKLRDGGYVPVEPFRVTAADGSTAIYGNLFRPSRFDPSSKYPVIDAAYPGPQLIRTAKTFSGANFDVFEARSLAELGFIVVTIDGRGTPNRSRSFLDHSYGRLEKASDLEDHIAGIRQLAQRYPYMDLDRVGIDGASGGGFMAALAILRYPDFYKVAVSAEGNHDLRGYMSPWGDTFLGPAKRADYSRSSTLRLASGLKGKLLLMHGDMDDNVSPALTLRLVDALVDANKDFDLLILPNQGHSAWHDSTYFIRRKWDYFVRHLLRAEPPADYSIERPNGH